MRKTLALFLAAAAACGGSSSSMEQRSRDALPSKDGVAVGSPKSTAGSGKDFGVDEQNSTVGDASTYYATTFSLAVSINGATGFILGLIKGISDQPPTSCDTTSCTWGPGSSALDPVNYKLVVTYNASANSFDYTLSGQAKSPAGGDFKSLVTGTSVPSAIPHRGTGHFTVDFDASKALNPSNTDIGALQIAYDNVTIGKGHIEATFIGVKDGDHAGQKLNATYSFNEDSTGGGDLDVAFHNTTSQDKLSLHSRWKVTGAGRGDAVFTSASPAFVATVSECWSAPPFKVSYFESNAAAFLGPNNGAIADCAYPTASPSQKVAP